MVRESILLDTVKAIRVGIFALIRPVITSTDGRCVASTRWIPAARAFAPDVLSALPLFTYRHHQVGKFVHQHHNVWFFSAPDAAHPYYHPASSTGLESDASCDRLQQFFVITRQITHTQRRHQFITTLHLVNTPAQRVGGIFHISNNFR